MLFIISTKWVTNQGDNNILRAIKKASLKDIKIGGKSKAFWYQQYYKK